MSWPSYKFCLNGHPIFLVGRQVATGEAWLCPCPMLESLQNHPMRRKLSERRATVLWTGKGVWAVWGNSSRNHRFRWFLHTFVSFCVTLGIWTITFWSISPPRGAVGWLKIRGRTHVPPMVCSSPCRKSWELNHLYLAIPQLSCRYRFLLIDLIDICVFSFPKDGQLWTTESMEIWFVQLLVLDPWPDRKWSFFEKVSTNIHWEDFW